MVNFLILLLTFNHRREASFYKVFDKVELILLFKRGFKPKVHLGRN